MCVGVQSSLASVDTSVQSESGEISAGIDIKMKKNKGEVIEEDGVKDSKPPGIDSNQSSKYYYCVGCLLSMGQIMMYSMCDSRCGSYDQNRKQRKWRCGMESLWGVCSTYWSIVHRINFYSFHPCRSVCPWVGVVAFTMGYR